MNHPLGEVAAEIALRTLLIFVWCAVCVRTWGKRGLGELNVYDVATLMAVANAVQNGMTKGSGRISVGVVSASVLIGASYLVTRLFHRHHRLRNVIVGVPSILVWHGKRRRHAMRAEGVTEEELARVLRDHGLERIEEARLVVLEADGTMSVVERESPRK